MQKVEVRLLILDINEKITDTKSWESSTFLTADGIISATGNLFFSKHFSCKSSYHLSEFSNFKYYEVK